jgi:hypothetical protein
MSFPQRKKTMLETSVSFFNELSIEKQNYARNLSFIMDSKRKMIWKEYISKDKCHSWLLGYLL